MGHCVSRAEHLSFEKLTKWWELVSSSKQNTQERLKYVNKMVSVGDTHFSVWFPPDVFYATLWNAQSHQATVTVPSYIQRTPRYDVVNDVWSLVSWVHSIWQHLPMMTELLLKDHFIIQNRKQSFRLNYEPRCERWKKKMTRLFNPENNVLQLN